jgi:hypothetical protein
MLLLKIAFLEINIGEYVEEGYMRGDSRKKKRVTLGSGIWAEQVNRILHKDLRGLAGKHIVLFYSSKKYISTRGKRDTIWNAHEYTLPAAQSAPALENYTKLGGTTTENIAGLGLGASLPSQGTVLYHCDLVIKK